MLHGVLVRSLFVHEGPARRLVHRLKYEAVAGIAGRLAPAMVSLLPRGCSALVPVPRVVARRARYGVDPALALARALGDLSGIPVVSALRADLWNRHRAGRRGVRRGVPRFSQLRRVPRSAMLIDDVVTTGATLQAAAAVTGVGRAVTITAGRSALTWKPPNP